MKEIDRTAFLRPIISALWHAAPVHRPLYRASRPAMSCGQNRRLRAAIGITRPKIEFFEPSQWWPRTPPITRDIRRSRILLTRKQPTLAVAGLHAELVAVGEELVEPVWVHLGDRRQQ